MNASIKAAIESGAAQTVAVEALARGSDGYLHIADERKVPPAGRIPEPEDILGSVYVEDGEVSLVCVCVCVCEKEREREREREGEGERGSMGVTLSRIPLRILID